MAFSSVVSVNHPLDLIPLDLLIILRYFTSIFLDLQNSENPAAAFCNMLPPFSLCSTKCVASSQNCRPAALSGMHKDYLRPS